MPFALTQTPFIPAQAGIQCFATGTRRLLLWVPAFAGTNGWKSERG